MWELAQRLVSALAEIVQGAVAAALNSSGGILRDVILILVGAVAGWLGAWLLTIRSECRERMRIRDLITLELRQLEVHLGLALSEEVKPGASASGSDFASLRRTFATQEAIDRFTSVVDSFAQDRTRLLAVRGGGTRAELAEMYLELGRVRDKLEFAKNHVEERAAGRFTWEEMENLRQRLSALATAIDQKRD